MSTPVIDIRKRKVEIGKVLDVVENQIEHCDAQIHRFKDDGDKRTVIDWIAKKVILQRVLEQIKDIYQKGETP